MSSQTFATHARTGTAEDEKKKLNVLDRQREVIRFIKEYHCTPQMAAAIYGSPDVQGLTPKQFLWSLYRMRYCSLRHLSTTISVTMRTEENMLAQWLGIWGFGKDFPKPTCLEDFGIFPDTKEDGGGEEWTDAREEHEVIKDDVPMDKCGLPIDRCKWSVSDGCSCAPRLFCVGATPDLIFVVASYSFAGARRVESQKSSSRMGAAWANI